MINGLAVPKHLGTPLGHLGTVRNREWRIENGSIENTAIYSLSVTLPRDRLSRGDLGFGIWDLGFWILDLAGQSDGRFGF